MERKGTRFGASARAGNWSAKPPIKSSDAKMKNVFLIMADSADGRRWVETAYANKEKANLVCDAKNSASENGTRYTVLHTPVND